MHRSVMAFGQRHLTADMCAGRHVLEVGSQNVNGSLRTWVEERQPATYFGIDMQPGVGVDMVITVQEYAANTPDQYDLIICTEMLEHASDWRGAIEAMHILLYPGGHLLLTTRSPGFPRHAYPDDYWRFEIDYLYRNMLHYGFAAVEVIPDTDPKSPGVFMMLRKDAPIGVLREPVYLEPHKVPA